MRENRASHLVGWKTHPTILPRSGFELTTFRTPWLQTWARCPTPLLTRPRRRFFNITGIHAGLLQPSSLSCTIFTRAGTNTPSDEYDSYREYRVHMYSRIQWFAYSEEVLFGRSFIRQIHVGYIIHKTETPIKTCNVLLAWEPPFKKI